MRPVPLTLTMLALAAAPAFAQAPADSAAPARALRAAWLQDRRSFTVGDILTVLVEEQASASERVDRSASTTRSQRASTSAQPPSGTALGAGFSTGLDQGSRQSGANSRIGQLTGTLSVRVTEVRLDGTLQVEGRRDLLVDGRRQELSVTGAVRPEDVSPQNVVFSSRLADAQLTYRGPGTSPKRGIVGRILGMFWP